MWQPVAAVPVKNRLRHFDAVVGPVALFGCGHRTVHQNGLHQLDVAHRKFLRAVVGPLSNLDWSRPWHVMIGMETCNQSEWNMVGNLEAMPGRRHTVRCPRHNWATKLSVFLRFLQMDDWQILALNTKLT